YMLDRGALAWDVGGVVVRQDRDRKTWFAVYRQPQPTADAGKERRERWEHMTRRDGDFSGVAQHDDEHAGFWIRTVASGGKPAAGGGQPRGPPYQMGFNTHSKPPPPQPPGHPAEPAPRPNAQE